MIDGISDAGAARDIAMLVIFCALLFLVCLLPELVDAFRQPTPPTTPRRAQIDQVKALWP